MVKRNGKYINRLLCSIKVHFYSLKTKIKNNK